ncbi:MAG TPA: DUF4340 domain-containing protein [Spirochaetota bacterium]
MSKKTKLSFGIIALLLLVILGQKYINFSHVPSVKAWKGDADEIVITNKGASPVSIHKKDGAWVVGDKNFAADINAVSGIEKKMKELSFSELVTKKAFYERFDLTADSAIRVTVKSGGKVLRDILVGKGSGAGDLCYVKFTDKPEVYLAGGNLIAECNKNIDSLRDRSLIALTIDTIDSVTVNAKGERYTLTREAVKTPEKKDDKSSAQAPGGKWVVTGRTGDVNQNKVTEYLNEFAGITAQSFPNEEDAKKRASSFAGEITLKAKGKTIVFTVYGKNEEDKGNTFLCRSSENPYFANVAKWKIDRLLNGSGDLFKK